MISAKNLRNKADLSAIPNNCPGYYKWWAELPDLMRILKELKVDFGDIQKNIETKDNLYCLYVGIAVKESLRERLNWHVNDSHSPSKVRNGTLSTLRQSISSIVAHDQYDKEATNAFIDHLFVEYFESDKPIKSDEAKNEIHAIEKALLNKHLYVLNIQENKHPAAINIKRLLRKLRKEIK